MNFDPIYPRKFHQLKTMLRRGSLHEHLDCLRNIRNSVSLGTLGGF